MYRIAGIVLPFFIAFQLCAQNVVISGKAIDYSGKEIAFYTYADPIVHQKQELGNVKVGTDGSFSVNISVSEIVEVYADLDKYTGTVVIEPGKNYFVSLPPFTPKTSVEARSPFFKPTLYWLGLPQAQSNDINFEVRSFITDYNLETVKNSTLIYQKAYKDTVKGIIERLEQKYPDKKNDYFRTLKIYYCAELEYAVNQSAPGLIVEKYFATNPLKLYNPAYQRCFESIFSDFLRKEAQNYKNSKIVMLVNSGDFSGLVSFFENKGYKKDFAELVVLKGLYDGYYTGGFTKASILNAIDQSRSVVSSDILKPIVVQISNKLTMLSAGGTAPSFKLTNLRNELVTLEKYHGKFVYLVFFKSNSSDCRAELDSIVSIEKKFRQVLSIVSIATDDNFDTAVKLWKDKGYRWDLLNGSNNKQLIDNYNAKIVPSFYLIAPDGTFLLSQAPPPSHDFEPMFLKIFRDYNFKQPKSSIKSN